MSAFLLLLSAVLITVGNTYYVVLLGRLLHGTAMIFHSASVVALENNVDLVNRREDFVRIRTAGTTIYSVVTMLISFVASYLFNFNHYLPMICSIGTCSVGFVLSLLMKDCSNYNKISYKKGTKTKIKVRYGGFLILIILAYSIFYPIVNNGQSEGKLFIQQNLMIDFDLENTALIIGAIVCVSRVIRVLSNLAFPRIYKKYQSKVGVAMPILLGTAMGCLLFGSFIPQIVIKIIVMAAGYTVILFVRDPFKLYIQDVVFASTPKEQHQTLLTMLEFGVKIGGAGMGLGFSAILLASPMVTVMAIMFAISVVEIILCLILYRAVLIGKKQKETAIEP